MKANRDRDAQVERREREFCEALLVNVIEDWIGVR
jgi:hypothetical protein